MRGQFATVLLLAAWPALAQDPMTDGPCRMDGADCGLASPLTTKGDVWGFSTLDARLPVGTDGQILTADSAQTLGMKWAAAPGDVTAVNITTTAPVTGGANCASGTCAFTLGITGGTVSGLTTNKVAKASSATALADSSITDDGTTLTLGNAGVTVTEASGAVGLTAQAVGTVPLAITGAANQTARLLTLTGGATPGAAFASFVDVAGTLPASPGAAVSGISATITSAGSAAQAQYGQKLQLAAGYTGANSTRGLFVENLARSTGTTLYTGNIGLYAEVYPSAGVAMVGVGAFAASGTGINVGGFFDGGYGGTGTYQVGVVGRSPGSGGTGNAGGYFSLETTGSGGLSFATSAALIANNGSVAAPIFLARDNGTTVFSVEDGGGNYRQRKVTANTGTATPGGTVSDVVYTNEGDGDGSTITLPTAAANLTYTVYVQAAQTITITAAAGDTIRIAGNVTAAAGSITSNVVGSAITLVAINADEWVAISVVGTWVI